MGFLLTPSHRDVSVLWGATWVSPGPWGGQPGWGSPVLGPEGGGGCCGAQQGGAVPVMPGLSAGAAEAGQPVREERLAAGPWRGWRLQVGWGQAAGAAHGPPNLEMHNANQDSGVTRTAVGGMSPIPGPCWDWGCWRSCWASPKAVTGQGVPGPVLTLCPQERGRCLERRHRGDSTRRAGPCHRLRELPRPGRRGRPQRPPLQGEDAQEGTGARTCPLCPGGGDSCPPQLTLPTGHRAAAEGAGGAAGDGEGAGQGEEAVQPPPAQQRGGQGQGGRCGGAVSGGHGAGGCRGCGVVSHPLPPSPASAGATGGYFTPRPACKSSAPRSVARGLAGYPPGWIQGDTGHHRQASLPMSPQFSARLAEHSRQLAGVQNEYSFALVSASAHLEHYQRVELPAAMQVGDARTPRTPSPGSHRERVPTAGTGSGLAALGAQGRSSGGMWQCCGGSHLLSPGTGRGPLRAAPGALVGRQLDRGGDLPGHPGLVPGHCGGICAGNGAVPELGGARGHR